MGAMRRWQFWLGVLISLFFMGWVIKDLLPHLDDFWESLLGANYWWLVPGVMVYFLAVLARAWRWHYLLRPIKSIRTLRLFPITAIGYMGNNIYPARAGEVLRAVILKKSDDVPIMASLATIIVERIFDGVVMLAFIFLNIPELMRLSGGSGVLGEISIRDVALYGSIFFFGALIVFLLAAMFPNQTEAIVDWFVNHLVPSRFRVQILGLAKRFLSGLEALHSPAAVLMIFVTSVVIWLLETGKYWLVMQGFPFQVSFFTLMLMNGIVNLTTTIPSAPGYWGTFDKPGIEVLKRYAVPDGIAASYTIVLHIALWVPITVLGAYYLARTGLRWTEAMQQAKVEEGGEEQKEETG